MARRPIRPILSVMPQVARIFQLVSSLSSSSWDSPRSASTRIATSVRHSSVRPHSAGEGRGPGGCPATRGCHGRGRCAQSPARDCRWPGSPNRRPESPWPCELSCWPICPDDKRGLDGARHALRLPAANSEDCAVGPLFDRGGRHAHIDSNSQLANTLMENSFEFRLVREITWLPSRTLRRPPHLLQDLAIRCHQLQRRCRPGNQLNLLRNLETLESAHRFSIHMPCSRQSISHPATSTTASRTTSPPGSAASHASSGSLAPRA